MSQYQDATAFRMALEQRLKNRSTATGQSLERLRRYVAFEALLARLFSCEDGAWALKGALALEYRFDLDSRPTVDIDLQRLTAVDRLEVDLIEATERKRPDFFTFSRPQEATRRPIAGTRRFKLTADMAKREFAQLQLDIGTVPLPGQPSELLTIPSLLEFADLPATPVIATTLPFHVAEKVHAYVKPRARENTRIKDLIDLQLIFNHQNLDTEDIKAALQTVFTTEATVPIPEALPHPPASWIQRYATEAEGRQLPADLNTAHQAVAAIIDPILRDLTPSVA